MGVDRVVVAAGGPQALLVDARHGHGQAEHLDDRRAQDAAEADGPPADHVGDQAPLTVGRVGQGHERRLPGGCVALVDRVADGEDVRVRRAHLGVDLDPATRTELQSSRLRQGHVRAHADAHDDHVGVDLPTVGEHGRIRPDLGHLHPEGQLHTVLGQLGGHQRGHLGVQRGHDLRGELHHRDGHPTLTQALGHLQADESPTHDHRAVVVDRHTVLTGVLGAAAGCRRAP